MERNEIIELCKKVRESSYTIAKLTTKEKNELLKNIQKNLINSREKIMAQNQIDISNGEKKGLNKAMLDRLLLTEKRFTEMATISLSVAALSFIVGILVKHFLGIDV